MKQLLAVNLPTYNDVHVGNFKYANKQLGEVITDLFPVVFRLAGIILFAYLLWGGIQYLTSAGNPDKTKVAQGKITTALIGFAIIFTSWWIIQIIETVFGIKILTG